MKMSLKSIIFTILFIAAIGCLASPTEKPESSSDNFELPDIPNVNAEFALASFIKFLVFGAVVSGIAMLLNNCGVCDKIPTKAGK